MLIFHIVANVLSFVFDSDVTHTQLLSVMQTPSGGILLRKHIPRFHGAADLARGGAPAPLLTRVFVHLPTSDVFVSAVTCVDVLSLLLTVFVSL